MPLLLRATLQRSSRIDQVSDRPAKCGQPRCGRLFIMDSSEQKSPLVYVLVAVGVVSLLMAAWVLSQRSGSTASAKTAKVPASLSSRAQAKASAPQCVPAAPHPVDQLQIQMLHAHDLVRQRSYAPAISLYREIADADPSYPGIQLELSMALLDAKQPEAANDAVNAQLATSTCLGELTLDQIQAYCRAEMPGVRFSTCQEQVLDMRRSAHLHAALIQMQLGRDGAPALDANTASPQTGSHTAHTQALAQPLSPSANNTPTQVDRAAQKPHVAGKAPSNAQRSPLERGDETDTALGAYSR